MLEIWYRIVEFVAPFEWAHYDFMKNALLAVLLLTPLLALIGTMVVNYRMAFFSDVLGHSALTGMALGVLAGAKDPVWGMAAFMVALAVVISLFKETTRAAFDTVLGVFFGVVVAFGIMILSRGGNFAKFASYLIGDVLSVSPNQILGLLAVFWAVCFYWIFFGNALVLIAVSPVLAFSRRIPIFLIQVSFAVLLAIVVAFSVRLVGILMINSLLVLPAAAARNLARDVRGYTFLAVVFSLASGVTGLLLSYFWGTSAGATIVLAAAFLYALSWGMTFFKVKIQKPERRSAKLADRLMAPRGKRAG